MEEQKQVQIQPSKESLDKAKNSHEYSMNLLNQMMQQYQTQAPDVRCVIGTGIDFHSFEVGAEVVEAFQGQIDLSNPERVKAIGPKYRLNLPGILQDQLIAAGILSTHIEVLGGDTLTDENYFSYRRQQGITGRQGVIVGWQA